ncbi:MAG: HNH endonuclease [Brevundimonas sp.]
MAVTKGHGNPNWNRDETILALDAYFRLAGKNPSARDPLIITLSDTLRALPYHGEASRMPTFRNPDGAAFKVQNLKSRETGKGLGNVSRMDREVWNELSDDRVEVARLADLIRDGIAASKQVSPSPVDESEDVEFYEGRLLTQRHLRRERSSGLRRALLKKRVDTLSCDICSETHATLPPELRASAFEGHHVIPIAFAGEGPTRLSDVALTCATCHRLLHRLISIRRRWVGIAEAKAVIVGLARTA